VSGAFFVGTDGWTPWAGCKLGASALDDVMAAAERPTSVGTAGILSFPKMPVEKPNHRSPSNRVVLVMWRTVPWTAWSGLSIAPGRIVWGGPRG
jgi:hypothetical protein